MLQTTQHLAKSIYVYVLYVRIIKRIVQKIHHIACYTWMLDGYISPAIYYCLDIAVGGIVYVQIDMWVMLRLQQNITSR